MVIVIIKMNAMPYKRRLWPKKTAGLIKKETDEHPTSNVQRPTSNIVFYRFIKGTTCSACVAPVNTPLQI
ncbi:MAG: hypothetical protein QNJ58_01980 [Desulfobacterales bacterium]|nr:hypothetical protein [Desulfobacterales bacterium]